MGHAVLAIEQLQVNVAGPGGRAIVKGVSLQVMAGETVCVVGESGSGKSVMAFSAMGLLAPDELRCVAGRILLAGENLLDASPARQRELRGTQLAMVFQEPMTALNPVEKIGWQIDEVLRLHGCASKTHRRAQVLEMLRSVHMPDPARIYEAYPHQLSGGQRQRVVISMALILKPKLLIADEPTTALDVTTQKQILALVRELQQQHGTAVLFITHDFGVVAEIANRVVVMNHGQVVEAGTRDDILMRPATAYTRTLVSSVPSLVPETRPPSQGAIVLQASGLGKTYSQRRWFGRAQCVAAAQDIHFTLRRGEILGLVGESGCGKSTVARCIVRLQEPSSGAIHIHGVDIARTRGRALRALRQRVQIVFQDPYRSLNPRVRVGESMIEGLINHGMPRPQAMHRARALCASVGVDAGLLERYPHQFSGGQRQRICIARALALEPDILVADEAVSALDVSVQAQVLALLQDIRQRTGVAILFITHDLRVAAQICDNIMVMQHGRTIEQGPAAQVLTAPSQPYTNALIEAAPGRDWDFKNFRPLARSAVRERHGAPS